MPLLDVIKENNNRPEVKRGGLYFQQFHYFLYLQQQPLEIWQHMYMVVILAT